LAAKPTSTSQLRRLPWNECAASKVDLDHSIRRFLAQIANARDPAALYEDPGRGAERSTGTVEQAAVGKPERSLGDGWVGEQCWKARHWLIETQPQARQTCSAQAMTRTPRKRHVRHVGFPSHASTSSTADWPAEA
jgi:hypothetical protein